MKDKTWEISPKGHSHSFEELWSYRYLLGQLIQRDFVALYKQTLLGPLWLLITPILTTSVFCLVFGKLIGVSTSGIPKSLFYLIGMAAWGYFYECFTRTSTVLRENLNTFGKIYFPRIIVPIGISISMLIRFGIQLSLVLFALLFYQLSGVNISITSSILSIPFTLVLIAFQAIGLGLIITSLTVKYRDLSILISFGLQMGFYITPVIYPLSSVSSDLRIWIQINPMTTVIELFRYAIINKGDFSILSIMYTCAMSLGLIVIGVKTFSRTQKTYIDNI